MGHEDTPKPSAGEVELRRIFPGDNELLNPNTSFPPPQPEHRVIRRPGWLHEQLATTHHYPDSRLVDGQQILDYDDEGNPRT